MNRTEFVKRILVRILLGTPLVLGIFSLQFFGKPNWWLLFLIVALISYSIFAKWVMNRYFAITVVSFNKIELSRNANAGVRFDLGHLMLYIGIIVLFLPSLLNLFLELASIHKVLLYAGGIVFLVYGFRLVTKSISDQKKLNESKLLENMRSKESNEAEAIKKMEEYKRRTSKSALVIVPIMTGVGFIMISSRFFIEPIGFIAFGVLLVVCSLVWAFWESEQQRKIISLNKVDFITGKPNQTVDQQKINSNN